MRLCIFYFMLISYVSVKASTGIVNLQMPNYSASKHMERISIANVKASVKRQHIRVEVAPSFINKTNKDTHRFNIEFGKISKEEFDRLTQYFRSSESLKYERGKYYVIKDFLSEFIKLTEGHQFITQKYLDPEIEQWVQAEDKTDYRIELNTNCWHTTIEFLRASDDYLDLYYIPKAKSAELFLNQDFFKPVAKEDLTYGDVLFIGSLNFRTDEVVADHAAVYLGAGYYFEKTGLNSKYIYRIVPASYIEEIYGNYDLIKYYSFTGKKLPSPKEFMMSTETSNIYFEGLENAKLENMSLEVDFGQGHFFYNLSPWVRVPLSE